MKILKSKKLIKYFLKIGILLSFSLINILEINSSGNKPQKQILSEDFAAVYFSNSNSFEEDDFNIQLKKFFGFNPKDSTKRINYPDLSIKDDSKNLRELYEAKLNQMTSNNNEQPNNVESFFKEKL